MSLNDTSFIQDLPAGPLDDYRSKASFDWKKLKLVFEGAERLKIKYEVWNTLENDPLFRRSDDLSVEQQKFRAARQLNRFRHYSFVPLNPHGSLQKKLQRIMSIGQAIVVVSPDVTVKYFIEPILFQMSVITLGSERHKHIVDATWEGKLSTAFLLTEISHGSNAKNMQTTATYDENTQEFILNTPNFKAAKCWAANLGKNCTVAIVFAQLYTKGTCYGLHAFLVPIRDPKTLLPYPGLIVRDGSEKLGLNGVDNGCVLFQHYRIPRENLLNRVADVTPEGDYKSDIVSHGRLLSATLGNLLTGRVAVIQESGEYLTVAVSIAIRYAAMRKQFGPSNDEEVAIIEYPLHQWRLFPYLAAAAVLKIFSTELNITYIDIVTESYADKIAENMQELKSEIHALISATKPLMTWTCQAAIQECREACGGHGYLKAARFGDLRNTNDARVTYEGDNNILLQQTSRWLLKQWDGLKQGIPVCSPFKTCAFLSHYGQIIGRRSVAQNVDDVANLKFLAETYEWLILYLLQETEAKLRSSYERTECLFTAFNDSQVYKASVLARAYVEYVALIWYWKRIHNHDVETNLQPILEKLGILYGLSSLDKHMAYLYMGGFCSQSLGQLVKNGILDLCSSLKPDAISVVDALAPTDFAVNSVLGNSDGRLYEHLETEFLYDSNATARPEWWNEVLLHDLSELNLTSKL